MPRNIYLVRYSGFPFKDHWAILIPSATISTFGTLIQVEGNPRYGFVHSVVRNYDLSNETRSTKVTLLGEVEEKYMHDTPSAGTLIESDETNPRDEIERVALSVAAPGKSMRAVSGDTPPVKPKRVEFSGCQWWVPKVVSKLVDHSILPKESLEVLDAIAKN